MDDFEQARKSHIIDKLIARSYAKREFEATRMYIEGAFLLADKIHDNWNYDNILHKSYTYLGLIALEENDIKEAKKNLILSGAIEGSPQLKSFGPDMILAKKLLERGEKQIVLRYLNLCSNFWIWPLSFSRLKKWRKAIRAGIVPDFGVNYNINLMLHESPVLAEKYDI